MFRTSFNLCSIFVEACCECFVFVRWNTEHKSPTFIADSVWLCRELMACNGTQSMAIFLPGARMVYRHCAPWIIADLKTASHAVSHFHRPAWKQPRPKVVDGIHRALGEQEKILLCPPNVDEARQRVQIERKQFLEIDGYDVFVRGFILIFLGVQSWWRFGWIFASITYIYIYIFDHIICDSIILYLSTFYILFASEEKAVQTANAWRKMTKKLQKGSKIVEKLSVAFRNWTCCGSF